jgi:hypothetical protein
MLKLSLLNLLSSQRGLVEVDVPPQVIDAGKGTFLHMNTLKNPCKNLHVCD